MADVNISKYRASVVRDGSKPASPGFVVSEGQDPVDPAGSGQNHLPVTIATEATGFSITDSQVLSGAGTVSQYIRGDGSLADFPEASGGGSSISYYLNGSINQGTIGGVAYKELSKVPILGAGTDFTINADGYIASFLTDAGDPNLLEIPGGNWNFETYFSASSGGGSPRFYVELYKYNGTTFTLLASNSTFPELIAFGTNITAYFSTLAVPTTTLALTDRLAIRYYVTHSGRTITMHTEDNHLCQIVTTFTTGLTALNGLTAQVQNFAVGTSGTDFNIASATATHTFNLPTASGTNRGALSSTDWTTFNNKQNALTNPVTGTGTNNYLPKFTGLTTIGDSVIADNTNEVNISKRIFLNSGGQSIFFTPNLSGVSNRIEGSSGIPLEIFTGGSALRLGAGGSSTQINLASTGVVTMSNLAGTGSRIVVADASGNLSASSALSGYVQGSGTTNYLPKFTGTSTIGNSNLINDASGNLGLGVIPSAGGLSGYVLLQIAAHGTSIYSGTNQTLIGTNILWSGGSASYSTSTFASLYNQQSGQHQWFNAPSGTAGAAISFTQAMTLNASGNLLVGTTTDNGARLQVSGDGYFSSSSGTNRVRSTNTGTTGFSAAAFEMLVHNGSTVFYGGGMFQTNSTFVYAQIAANQTNIYGYQSGGMRLATGTAPIIFATGNADLDLSTARFTISSTGFVSAGATTNGRLGVRGFTNDSSGYAFEAANASGNTLFIVRNDGISTFSSNVGIGTFSPSAPLHIVTPTGVNFQNAIRFEKAGGYGEVNLENYYTSGSNYGFGIDVAGTTMMVVNNSGNVGIGTSSPTQALTVNGRIRVSPDGVNGGDMAVDAGGLAFCPLGSTPITFQRSNFSAESMRITSSGNVLIGTTTDSGYKTTIAGAGGFLWATNGSANSQFFLTSGNNLIITNANSQGVILNNGATSWSSYSDIRLKNVNSKIENALQKLTTLTPINFTWKNDYRKKETLGLIAQELEKVFPQVVEVNDDNNKTLSVKYSELIPVLVSAIQELKQEIDTLKN